MTRSVQLFVCLIATLCTEAAFAQVAPTEADGSVSAATSSSPVAYVYVSSSPSGNKNKIDAYSAASDGKLTPVAGSPFSAKVQYMAVNGKYLFGTNGSDIDSFSIASDGALKQISSINTTKFDEDGCGAPLILFLDRTGKTLYDLDIENDCANNAFQFFGIHESTGELTYLGVSSAKSPQYIEELSFIGNNIYAYGSRCFGFERLNYGFKRSSDGTLTAAVIDAPFPAAKEGDFYCPYLAAADPTHHVAVALQVVDGDTFRSAGPPQLATYTADDSGKLATTSTRENMPETAVGNVNDINISPSGKLLAVGGDQGLQVFHFNGSDPITHYTGLLTTDEVDQFFWDNDNHLYAISHSHGKLFVFTITPTSFSQASGSPHTITNPQTIIVQPKT
jgi:hypothetical protein